MASGDRFYQTGHGRVFIQKNPGPGSLARYKGNARVTGLSLSEGDITPLREPSASRYDEFETVGTLRGDSELPSASVVTRFGLTDFILAQRCPFDVHLHYGLCEQPNDFNGGWEKGLIFRKSSYTTKSTDDLVALDSGERAEITVTGEFTSWDLWILHELGFAERAETEATREVVKVLIDDYEACGACGWESDGNKKIYAITKSSGAGSPGLPAEVLYSEDGGATWDQYDIDTLTGDDQPSDAAVVGDKLVVVSEDSASLHIADKSDLDSWSEVTTGIVVGGAPRSIFVLNSTAVWLVGVGGYVYFSDDISSGVEEQDDGTASGDEDLRDIHMSNSQQGVAVGETGAVIFTSNGGVTWSAATTSPTVSIINCVWARTPYIWMIGTADGRIYYTRNQGTTWTEQSFAGSGAGQVRDIVFAGDGISDGVIGYMSHDTATPRARIFRSIDNGASWYTLPEGAATLPLADQLNSLAAGGDGNFIVAGGLADDGSDGIVIVGDDPDIE